MKSLARLFCCIAALASMASAHAQEFPNRPIRLIVPYGAGTATDALARTLSSRLATVWKQGVVVENVTGAGGVVGTQQLQRAEPDGYTLGLVASGHVMNVALYPKLPFDPIRDFVPIMQVAETPMVFVAPVGGESTFKGFIDNVKAHPGRVDYGSTGNGSLPHLTVELARVMTGTHMVHIPYRNTAGMLTDLISGRVAIGAVAVATAIPQVKAGKLVALAMSTPQRSRFMPDVPAANEVIKGYDISPWIGIVAPKGTPAAIVSRIRADVAKAIDTDDVRNALTVAGVDIKVDSGTNLWERAAAEVPKWQELAKTSGIRME